MCLARSPDSGVLVVDRMIAKVYRELMILGFISFGVVVCGVRDLLPPGLCPAAARPPRNAEMSVWVGRRRSST